MSAQPAPDTHAQTTAVARFQTAHTPAPIIVDPTVALMDVISRAASDPSFDADKVDRLISMYERVNAQSARAQYIAALAEMQPKLPVIDERGGIKNNNGEVQSTYAKWEDINDAIRPVLADYGFALSFRTSIAQDGKIIVTGILAHRGGHQEETAVTLPHDSSGNKNAVQAVGSSTSYGKRYAAMSLLNITSRAPQDRDDDGQAGGTSPAAQDAITSINVAETLDELRKWKGDHFEALKTKISAQELRMVVELYNRRSKAFRTAQQKAQAESDFPGDRK